MAELGWEERRAPRSETDAPVVHVLRAFAIEAALVRRIRGKLRLTGAGRRAAAYPSVLWERVVVRCPWRRACELVAGIVSGSSAAVFDALQRWYHEPVFRGCAMVNAAAQHHVEAVRAITARHLDRYLELLTGIATHAGATDPHVLGRQLLMLVEGATVVAGGVTRRRRRILEAGGRSMRYLMRKQMFSIGDDFWIEDERGQRVLRVDGKILRIRQTFVLEDPDGRELATIRKKLVALHDTMDVERNGQLVARVRKALFTPFRQHFDVDLGDGARMVVQGNITDHEYDVRRDHTTVAEISKRWFSLRDTYAVDVVPGEDVALVLSLTVAVDWMGHEEHEER